MKVRNDSDKARHLFNIWSASESQERMNAWRDNYNQWRDLLISANRENNNKRKSAAMAGMNRCRAALKNWMGAVELHLLNDNCADLSKAA